MSRWIEVAWSGTPARCTTIAGASTRSSPTAESMSQSRSFRHYRSAPFFGLTPIQAGKNFIEDKVDRGPPLHHQLPKCSLVSINVIGGGAWVLHGIGVVGA
ncbi:hypothetical protein [Paracoccus sp. DMF]|uniref:hypothetical protein n=1 Tax=Paracoccus sp. DMF TaxID=400837 RepID=UPI001104F95D|nr:hypothetical protein [Paracoccus sp. DMF]MCV2447742.1 hypothetical protein [Paracoccus sp. DMF]